jgi:hypothetical protein
MPKFIDLTGQKFGSLLVLSRAPNKGTHTYWKTLCDCGKEHIVNAYNLKIGKIQSCGCLRDEKTSKKNTINEINNRYEKLLVIKKAKTNKHRQAQWVCQCDCGNHTIVVGSNLRNGHTTSCGCINSKAEEKINKILSENNINYKTQYTFEGLVGLKKQPLRFDFAIFKNNKLSHLIEYDGIQHFDKNDKWYSENTIKNDKEKDLYCEKNNIELRRFSGGFENITLEQLI